jgi:ArsR family transcriptional regulator, arsenate/arsenite/antimonite-responsive transcriptional repressor
MRINIIRAMQTLVAFSKAMADPTRQEILRHLCCQWLSVNDVVDALNRSVSQPTVSHHLKVLESANLVQVRQEGRQRFYSLDQAQFSACCTTLVRDFAPLIAPDVLQPRALEVPDNQ